MHLNRGSCQHTKKMTLSAIDQPSSLSISFHLFLNESFPLNGGLMLSGSDQGGCGNLLFFSWHRPSSGQSSSPIGWASAPASTLCVLLLVHGLDDHVGRGWHVDMVSGQEGDMAEGFWEREGKWVDVLPTGGPRGQERAPHASMLPR